MKLHGTRTYVLVHGAWTGGWVWRYVATLLRQRGNVVYTPTLTGLGERKHLGRTDTNLETHICDVIAVIEFEDLKDVILVGWSYGGIVVAGVARRAIHRIRHLVFLDATYAKNGESAYDVWGYDVKERDAQLAHAHGGQASPPSSDYLERLIRDESLRAYVIPRITSQPIETFRQVVSLADPPAFATIPKTHIISLSDKTNQDVIAYKERVEKEPGFAGFRLIKTHHFALLTDPPMITRELVRCRTGRSWGQTTI